MKNQRLKQTRRILSETDDLMTQLGSFQTPNAVSKFKENFDSFKIEPLALTQERTMQVKNETYHADSMISRSELQRNLTFCRN